MARRLTLDEATWKRLEAARAALGCSYEELVVFALRQALDELEGWAEVYRQHAEYWDALLGREDGS